jgi:hypothetical protein
MNFAKKLARRALIGAAWEVYEDIVATVQEYGQQYKVPIDETIAEYQRNLEAALQNIEWWLDVVYEKNMDPRQADLRFASDLDADAGLGYMAPSQVVKIMGGY